MKVKIKDPDKRDFILGLLVVLVFVTAAAVGLFIAYKALGGAAQVWQGVKNIAAELWHKRPFDCILLFFGLALGAFGMLVAPAELYRKFRHWNDPKRVRVLDFAPEGVYVISDTRVLLPYPQTSLHLLFHISSHYNSKHHTRTAFIRYVKFVLTYEDISFSVKHVPTEKLIYRLADMHNRWGKFGYHCTTEHAETAEEQTLSKHILAQMENQIRTGLHCRYARRSALLLTAVILDVIAVYVCLHGWWMGRGMTFALTATAVLMGISGVLLALWSIDYTKAKKIERLRGNLPAANHKNHF